MTDPKLSHPGAVGLTRYDILRNDYDDYEIVPDEQPNVPGRFYLASEVDAALSAKDAEIATARWNKQLDDTSFAVVQAKLSAAEAELARVRERVLAAVDAEEELAGGMPDCIWVALNRRDTAESVLRALVKLTKQNISERIAALSTDGGAQR